MKRMKNLAACLVLAAASIAISSCQLMGLGSHKQAATGSIKISIPTLAPWLAAHMPKSASRAYLHASTVIVAVDKEANLGQHDWENIVSPTSFSATQGPNATSTIVGTLDAVPTGSNYRVRVEVYASASDGSPSVTGEETGVTVTENMPTDVTVTCFPAGIEPIDLTSAIMSTTQTGTLGPSSEAWYRLTFAAGKQYTAKLVSGSGITGYVFGPDGVYVGSSFSVVNPISLPAVTVTGDYYIGLASGAMAGDYELNVAAGAVSPVNPSVSISYPNAGSGSEITQGNTLSANGSYSDPQGDTDVASILVEVLNTDESSAGVSSSVGNFTAGMWNLSSLDTRALAVGSYYLRARVQDAETNWAYSMLTPITIVSATTPPSANAGAAKNVVIGTPVTLDGSASSGTGPLNYYWSFFAPGGTPDGSTAQLINAQSVSPTFTPDLPGIYKVQLKVSNSVGPDAYDYVTITAGTPPTAHILEVQSVVAGTGVTLDGSTSTGTDINFAWSILSKPINSTAELLIDNSVYPIFTPDLAGTYTVQLIVSSAYGSNTTSVTFTATEPNQPPVAVITVEGGATQVAVATFLVFDGSNSSDPDAGDSIASYVWYVNGTLTSSAPTPTWTHQFWATQTITLIVKDSFGLSSAFSSPVTITVDPNGVSGNISVW
jgi:hypothetical protein